MSTGLVHRHSESSDGRFLADLVGLFERRKIPLGDDRVCEHFETVLATNDAFRSQLFTLCSAMSRMSATDLSGDDLLHLVGRALGVARGGADLPESLRAEFLAGYDAWVHRDLIGCDDWPPARKPPAREEAPRDPGPGEPRNADEIRNADAPGSVAFTRPAGLPTVQEALELARAREPLEIPAPPPERAVSPSPVPENRANLDMGSLTIHELNAVLKEIEARMARLTPHLSNPAQAEPAPTVLPITGEPAAALPPLEEAGFSRTGPAPIIPIRAASPYEYGSEPASGLPLAAYDEDQFTANRAYRHPQWREDDAPAYSGVPEPLIPAYVPPVQEPEAASAPTLVHPASFVTRPPAGPPATPDTLKLKMYLLICALAVIVLVAAPMTGMVVYRSLHPVYVYHLPQPAATPAPAEPTGTAPSHAAGRSVKKGKSSALARKHEAQKRQPAPVEVWPPPQR